MTSRVHQWMLTMVAGSAVLGLPALALAAEEGANQNPANWNTVTFLSAIIVVILALTVVSQMVWPKILGALDARDEKIRSEIAGAEDARRQADEAMKEYQSRLAEAKAEAAAMIEKTKAEQTRLAADLRTKAEQELTDLRQTARQQIEMAKRAALNEIYNEAVVLSTAIAAKILQREVNAEDQRRLVEETVAEFTKDRETAGV